MARSPLRPLLALLPFLAGCATWSGRGFKIEPPRKITIAVLPLRSDVKIRRLKDLGRPSRSPAERRHSGASAPLGAPPSAARSDEAKQAAQGLKEATEAMTAALTNRLGSSYLFEAAPSTAVSQALGELGLSTSTAPWTVEQAQRAGRRLGVQTVLVVQLAGYGKVKPKWLFYLIGSGVVEGLVQGAAAFTLTRNAWVGAGLFAEEVLQESLTWGGGAFLFDNLFTPVILEGRLLDASNGQSLWAGTAFASLDRQALKSYPKSERKDKRLRLRLTSSRAQERLIESLEKKAWRSLSRVR